MSNMGGSSNEDLVSQESSNGDSEPPEGRQVKFSGSTTDLSKPPLERVLTSGVPLSSHGSGKDSDEESIHRLRIALGPSDSQTDIADTNKLSARPWAKTETTKEGSAERSGKDGTLSSHDNQRLQHMRRMEGQAFNQGTAHRPEGRVARIDDLASAKRNEGQDEVLQGQVREPRRADENVQRTEPTESRPDNQETKRNDRQFLATLSPNGASFDEDYPHRRPLSVEPIREVRTSVEMPSTEFIRDKNSGDTIVRISKEQRVVPVRHDEIPPEAKHVDVRVLYEGIGSLRTKVDEGIVTDERQLFYDSVATKDTPVSPGLYAEPVHILVGRGRKPKQGVTIATQVEDEDLLAKTICTQVSETELNRLTGMDEDGPLHASTVKEIVKRRVAETPVIVKEESRRSSNPVTGKEMKTAEPEVDSKRPQFHLNNDDDGSAASERGDVVDKTLRPVGSCAQLHGILRKAPSAKWGSQSTVAFDEMQPVSRANSIAGGDSDNNLRARSGSHPHVAFNEAHRNPSFGKKLSGMFHLGAKEDEASSEHGDAGHHHHHRPHMPHFGKHNGKDASHTSHSSTGSNSSGQRTDDSISPLTTGKKVPWYRRLFTKKKPMTRSFTMDDLKQDLKMDDHLIPEADLLAKLNVNPETGLSPDEAARRLAKDGKNALTPPKKVPEFLKFLHELVGGFSPLLEIGSALCFIAYGLQFSDQSDPPGDNLYLAIVLLCVVLITSGFLYLQKAKSEQIMEGFKNMLPQSAKVLRGGKVIQISAEDVVMGDIVELHGGDRIPADVRIIEAKGLKVDNASLTGESEAQSRSTESSENPLESKNLAFYTTNAVEGLGKAVVVRRGDATVMGRIAKLTTRIDSTETTIAREMRHFVILICIFALVMGGTIFIVAVAIGYGGLYAIILAIGLVVANVPEGIIITVTVMLTLTAKRMAKKNCLIKNLEAVETLGACSVICSDKTGTLTQNRMTVSHCWVDEEIFTMDTVTETSAGKNLPDTPTVKDLIRVATLCNRAKFKDDQMEKPIYQRECAGDASETALLKFTEIVTGDVAGYRQKNKAVAEIPFNSTNKYAVSIHETDNEGQKRYLLVMKGAPERIWDRCATVISHGQNAPKDAEWNQKFQDAYAELGSMGERVLGFALLPLPADKYPYPTQFDVDSKDFPSDGLHFVGLISLIDPPRAAVPDGVAKCRSAGIQVIMVTGDHPLTAKAIARNVGIISETGETVEDIAKRTGVDVKDVNPRDAQAIVIHGTDLREMSSDQLDDVLRHHSEIVFARTSPQQKLIIVEACQRSGAVVAVTGDGVNDSPALKKANIGIAMGITGSDVSKQAADIVLLDDNFASIVTGIEEGRLIFDNLKKTICYTMMSNIPEITPVLLYFILRIPLGLTTIPMLLICLGTDMVPSISMAHETAEADIMKMPPRHPDERLVSGTLLQCCYLQAGTICSAGAFFAYFVVLGSCGFWPSKVMGLRDLWEDPHIGDLQDSYGQEWNFAQRMLLQRTVQGAFFAAVVVFQWLDLITRKVRRKSVFQKGMRNWFLNFAIVFETLVTIFCIYVPVLNYALNLNTIRFIWWLPVIPFALYYFLFDEIRRYLIRRYPGGWWEREHYF